MLLIARSFTAMMCFNSLNALQEENTDFEDILRSSCEMEGNTNTSGQLSVSFF